MKTNEAKTEAQRPEYWSTLSEYFQDDEYQNRVGEEFYPDAKPERYFEQEDEEPVIPPVKRRTFLKLSGFAALAAMIQGCARPVEKILPYVKKPEEVTLGSPNYYASTFTEGGMSYGLLVKTREGRPIKLEGNPDHPVNRGTLDVMAQAAMMDIYNPDRLRFPMKLGRKFDGEVGEALKPNPDHKMETLDAEIGSAIKAARVNGKKVVLLSRTVNGPTNDRLLETFKKEGSGFEHVTYDPMDLATERSAYKAAFGKAITPRYRFAQADVVLLLGGNPSAEGASPVEYQQHIAQRRQPANDKGMSRIYAFEAVPSLSGVHADYRYIVRPEMLVTVGLGIANLLLESGKVNAPDASALRSLVSSFTPSKVESDTGVSGDELRRVANSLAEHAGHSIVYTQSVATATENAESLHLVGILLNHILGSYKHCIDTSVSPSLQAKSEAGALANLVKDMNAGNVGVLIVNGVNPVYTTPKSLGFKEAMSKVKAIVSIGRMMDETTSGSDYIVPGVHFLESWADAEAQTGLYSIQQPAIRKIFGELAADPLYNSRSWQESIMAFINASESNAFTRDLTDEEVDQLVADQGVEDRSQLDLSLLRPRAVEWTEYVQETWKEIYANGSFEQQEFEDFWVDFLQAGVIDTMKAKVLEDNFDEPSLDRSVISAIKAGSSKGARVLVAYSTNAHGDGNSMSNPFLIELPDPISKVCWDNLAAISPAMAEEIGVKDGDIVTVETEFGKIEVPAYIQPGVHEDVVSVMLGWGRNTFGGVGDGLGANAYELLGTTVSGATITAGIAVKSIERTHKKTEIANVQGHNYLHSPSYIGLMVNKRKGDMPDGAQLNEDGNPVYDRPIIGETTLNEWKENPSHAYPNHTPHGENPPSIWEGTHKYVGHHWGMSVDLNACNGCNACLVACSIENNVPVVGKHEVVIGREMHWIRLDRYYRGDYNNPDFVYMPLMCQHCDNAPCETVCPVIATMHNDEGINVMVYNRCVGTRYCANNCPYKVRRFNFWQYSDYRTGPKENIKRVSPLEMVLNPDVSTRSRGVMEKCTFCIQRIRSAKDTARDNREAIKDGDVVTACQQTCPARAITFGDLNDPESAVMENFKDPRSYGLLTDLSTDPSVRYMALVRNRDEPSPYRTMYQAHHLEHGEHGGDHGGSHDAHDDSHNGHDDHGHEPEAAHGHSGSENAH